MTHYRFLVESKPLPGREADYHAWYDGRHMQDLLQLPGAYQAQRFAVVGAPDSDSPAFFMIVDYETDDLSALLAEIETRSSSGAMPSSDALDRGSIKVTILEARARAA
ncbi:hypothetical protein [Sphingomonas turrisvirgatae]|uniref:EthD domain-containing protein n=1 Tax=Sphingomonas turrisvirgatae TaxID=1888892 RepID=A0A1E3M060_9SPHN|nr:hypothetical protein [Sphingomonas turrisvirgatae]ODP38420.1 hypothetical protein BFL28_13640 [Sphingomonas turrisvirgatae]